jgi:hypothetical protein
MMSRRDNDQALKRLKARNETLQVRLMALDALLRHEQQLVTLLTQRAAGGRGAAGQDAGGSGRAEGSGA